MWRYILIFIGGLNLTMACIMWFAPQVWYDTTPGVAMMGPFNLHFIRDIALAFLLSGGAILWGIIKGDKTALVLGAGWPWLHALFHLWIWMARGFPVDSIALVNLVGIQLPAWLALTGSFRFSKRVKK